jgi:sodium-dependent dicarboxylate transporter 2/3/5
VHDRGVSEADLRRLGAAVMLSISYAASIGGMATLVGTPPNLSYREQLIRLFPGAPPPSFAQWMMIGLPVAAIFLVVGWILLARVIVPLGRSSLLGGREAVAALRRELGPLRRDELAAASVFAATALLWVTRVPIDFGAFRVPGWGALLGANAGLIDDGVVAVAAALLVLALPSTDRPGERLLEWRDTAELPWGMLLVFGGGFALASGFTSSGLSAWLGGHFAAMRGAPPLLLMAVTCAMLTMLTEFTSNTATTEMALPILAAAAVATGIDPRYLMIPATLSASCAFMMPVGSPTQTIVFGSGWVPMRDMARAGIWFNLLGLILVPLVFSLLAGAAMGIRPDVMPSWSRH